MASRHDVDLVPVADVALAGAAVAVELWAETLRTDSVSSVSRHGRRAADALAAIAMLASTGQAPDADPGPDLAPPEDFESTRGRILCWLRDWFDGAPEPAGESLLLAACCLDTAAGTGLAAVANLARLWSDDLADDQQI
jgi:hypothetical protein